MKKSVLYRTFQVASAVAAYSMISIWASTKHIDVISNVLTEIDSLLVILAIAVALPYFCFKVLGKLYTPPTSRNLDKLSKSGTSTFSEDELNAIADQDFGTMVYRGSRYNPEDLIVNTHKNNLAQPQDEIKYRGVSVTPIEKISPQDAMDSSFLNERNSQKSAKPKERMKYRGSYID
jgi:hypothetical protein